MPVTSDVPTRERIVLTSAELFRRRGYAGTGLKRIATQAEAPFGSLYHFFPGGKEALAEEVLRVGGRFFLALYVAIAAEADGFPDAVAAFFAGAGETLRVTDYADACPIATVAGEVASTHDRLRAAAAEAFTSWLDALESDAVAAGVRPDDAPGLATSLLALLEGAFLLCRTLRSTTPMAATADAAVALVHAAIHDPEGPR